MVGGITPQHIEKRQEKQPSDRSKMQVLQQTEDQKFRGQGKLLGKVALVTGGDSAIGRAVSILFAKEGADVAIVYLNKHEDAEDTRQSVERTGRRCITIAGDLGNPEFCHLALANTVETFGRLDLLVNNADEQHTCHSVLEATPEDLQRAFATNVYAMLLNRRTIMTQIQVTDNPLTFTPEDPETNLQEIVPPTAIRVTKHTSSLVQERIRLGTVKNIARAISSPETIDTRLRELDREWDVERVLELNASLLALTGVVLGKFVNRKWLYLSMGVTGFLAQHALQGWCPPLPILRRMGIRTSQEIDHERYALKMIRGDTTSMPKSVGPRRQAEELLSIQEQ